jgi:hypothetical protein
MIMNFKRIIYLLILLMVIAMEIFAGGRNRAGTAGAQELLIPVGARGTAIGGSCLSSISGVDAVFWNPAGLAGSSLSAEAMFSTMNYLADVKVNSFAVVGNFKGFGTLAFSGRMLGFGDIPVTDETHPDGTGAIFSPNYSVIGLTYSNALTDRVKIGVTANVISERIISTAASGISFDAGIQYSGLGGVNGLKLGITVKNLGPSMKYDGSNLYRWAAADGSLRGSSLLKVDAASFELPSCFEVGVCYETNLASDHKLFVGTSFQNNNYDDDEYKLGVEYAFKDLIFIRGSYQMAPKAPKDYYLFGPAFGAGVHYATSGLDITVDYAYRTNDIFDASHIISLKLGF